ncbi:MAG: hypothetical protein JNN00_10860 [Chitinophagaceae bacterium]|nr:hypothetical protein [Chitinophagaceae bacterium]
MMKSACIPAGIILLIVLLSPDVSGQVLNNPDGIPASNKQHKTHEWLPETPVYASGKKEIAGILESDYPKTANSFTKLFPGAKDQLWIKENNVLFACFLDNGHRTTAVFSVQGKMNYAIANINSSSLPRLVMEKIKREYSTYTIFNIKQITAFGTTVFQVVIENNCEYILIKATGDEIEEVEQLIKPKEK